jgi:hypothetical protein
MRSLTIGLLATLVVGLVWFCLRSDRESEVTSLAIPISASLSPELTPGGRDSLADSEHRSEAEREEVPTGFGAENNHQFPSDGVNTEDQPTRPADPQREIRLNQLGMILEDYYQVREIEKSSKLCALVSVSVAVLLEQAGRFEEVSQVPTSVNLQDGVRTMSINNRRFHFTDQEFPEFAKVQDQHLSLPKEAQTSTSYVVPPELETMAMNLAERAQSALQK